MARIVFAPDNTGEAIAIIKALTGATNIPLPTAPAASELGQVLHVASKYLSVEASADIGFGFGSFGASADTKVLLQDYWWSKEVIGSSPQVNSWTFAAGFRVGIRVVGVGVDASVGLGALAVKAQTTGLNVQVQILRVGMTRGPSVPAELAIPSEFDVDKFGSLKAWEGTVIKYGEEKHSELIPTLVSASINIDGQRLLTELPGIRFAMWRIFARQTLKQALGLLAAGKAPNVSEGEVRAVYAAVFNDAAMAVPGSASEKRVVSAAEYNYSNSWLNGYRKL